MADVKILLPKRKFYELSHNVFVHSHNIYRYMYVFEENLDVTPSNDESKVSYFNITQNFLDNKAECTRAQLRGYTGKKKKNFSERGLRIRFQIFHLYSVSMGLRSKLSNRDSHPFCQSDTLAHVGSIIFFGNELKLTKCLACCVCV